ncbi:hypothetical protein C1752_13127 [Acaryochloris thomasi RCC1774]|uniref:CobQ/CobB/MinD/ParA nucleotide binding domain-containing protein n=1 Tax=Acaryochloris thomasi RCC1774 TaxID=1764569 RepID=A0A2W1JM96_9CYAN|nr:hypothetical protein [Acaryochloris thomasi]PZD70401.1 hypothetical protein C1752_13127 [Acaryochloris thomasi RCC1774]
MPKKKAVAKNEQGYYVNLWSGQKGGTGKSWGSRLDCQRHIDREQDFFLLDVDEGNSSTAQFYGDYLFHQAAKLTEVVERSSLANALLDAPRTKPTVVNCRAGSNEALLTWLSTKPVTKMAQKFGIKMRYIFVSDLDNDSLKLFRPTVEAFSPHMPLIFVANLGRNTMGTEFFDSDDFQKLLKQYKVPIIKVQQFDLELKRKMEGHNPDKRLLTWGEALNHESFGILGQAEVQAYLDDFYEQLDGAERLADLDFSPGSSR